MNSDKFLGCPYPIVKTPLGLLPTQKGTNQIKSDLLILLMTNPGERVMLPEYGVALRSLLFEQNDEFLANQAREMIIDAIAKWEPRIVIESIDVAASSGTEDFIDGNDDPNSTDHILYINIRFFDPDNIKEIEDLSLEVPLSN